MWMNFEFFFSFWHVIDALQKSQLTIFKREFDQDLKKNWHNCDTPY